MRDQKVLGSVSWSNGVSNFTQAQLNQNQCFAVPVLILLLPVLLEKAKAGYVDGVGIWNARLKCARAK